MALTLGSVTIADDGTVTKSGECGTLYDKLEADAQSAILAFPGAPFPTGPDAVPRLRAQARLATTIATYVYELLTTRAHARVGAAVASLQKTPNPNDPDALTAASGSNTDLPIV